ncbi:MAG: hypothetical protein ACFB10_11960 [Salibacteraceae bacterium]
MRVRSTKDVDQLDKTIQEELSIDMKTYRDDRIGESIGELLVLPSYAFKAMIRPVGIALLLYFLGYWVFDLVHVEYFFYGLLGLVLFLLSGLFLGLLLLMTKIRKDVWSIMEFTIGIAESAIEDLSKTKNKITPENRKRVYSLLFLGVFHLVVIPTVATIFQDGIPLVGGLLRRVIVKVLRILTSWMKIEPFEHDPEKLSTKEVINEVDSFALWVGDVKEILEQGLIASVKVAKTPFLILFSLAFGLLLLLLYLLNL